MADKYQDYHIAAKPILITLLAVIAIFGGSLSVLYWYYAGSRPSESPSRPVEAVRTDAVPFDRIQSREQRYLQSYGWISRQDGIAHIPISEAMDLVLMEIRQPPDEAIEEESP
ncbi:hypothetical protein F6455_03170 [Proteobacteria bacterium 005FR1]|nr:hypothetical protein [Proteobacteria bacterium 005FR1]